MRAKIGDHVKYNSLGKEGEGIVKAVIEVDNGEAYTLENPRNRFGGLIISEHEITAVEGFYDKDEER